MRRLWPGTFRGGGQCCQARLLIEKNIGRGVERPGAHRNRTQTRLSFVAAVWEVAEAETGSQAIPGAKPSHALLT